MDFQEELEHVLSLSEDEIQTYIAEHPEFGAKIEAKTNIRIGAGAELIAPGVLREILKSLLDSLKSESNASEIEENKIEKLKRLYDSMSPLTNTEIIENVAILAQERTTQGRFIHKDEIATLCTILHMRGFSFDVIASKVDAERIRQGLKKSISSKTIKDFVQYFKELHPQVQPKPAIISRRSGGGDGDGNEGGNGNGNGDGGGSGNGDDGWSKWLPDGIGIPIDVAPEVADTTGKIATWAVTTEAYSNILYYLALGKMVHTLFSPIATIEQKPIMQIVQTAAEMYRYNFDTLMQLNAAKSEIARYQDIIKRILYIRMLKPPVSTYRQLKAIDAIILLSELKMRNTNARTEK